MKHFIIAASLLAGAAFADINACYEACQQKQAPAIQACQQMSDPQQQMACIAQQVQELQTCMQACAKEEESR